MAEVGGGEKRAKQIAAIHLDIEELASVEMAKRQIASDEAGLAQLGERECRTCGRGLIGENAILERRATKIGMRKAAFDETASDELRLRAGSISPVDARKILAIDGISFGECALKLLGCHLSNPIMMSAASYQGSSRWPT